MSAGAVADALRVHDELSELAPLFAAAVQRALAECARQGLDAIVYEALRTQQLQAEYYARGRTKRPPYQTVTNAPTNLHSWHGYGLAIDVISRSKQWSAGAAWFTRVAEIFKANDCKWGGDWRSQDLPHFQWHLCKASPSPEARHLIATQGMEAVWRAVQAVDESVLAPAHMPAALDDDVSRTAVVTANGLNLRPQPSTANPPLALLARGARIDVLEPHGSWFRVRANGIVGFVHGDHIALRDTSMNARFLAADQLLRSVPLAPAELLPVAAPAEQLTHLTIETWNRYGGLLGPLCRKIGVAPAAAVAVLCVESGGRAFNGTRMIIRFEAHIFFRLWGKQNEALFRTHFRFKETEPWRGQEFSDGSNGFKTIHEKGQSREWQVFEAAARLNRAAALRSISMGAPQIMGFNHGAIGYDDVEDMFAAFHDERFQILGLFDFIKGDGAASRMVQALQQENYETFATRYNGAGQAAVYGARIRKYAEAFPSLQTV